MSGVDRSEMTDSLHREHRAVGPDNVSVRRETAKGCSGERQVYGNAFGLLI
jgi:hypothetical protein